MSLDIVPRNAVGTSTRLCTAKATIFVQGEEAKHIFYVRKGRIKLTVTSEAGKEAIVAIVGPGSFFGECAFNGQKFYHATATSLGKSTVTSISAESMSTLLKTNKDVADHFMEYLLDRTSRLEDDLKDQLFNSVEKRLARLLLKLADYGSEESHTVVPVSLTHAELAYTIGATRSRVTQFMGKFRNLATSPTMGSSKCIIPC